ncbi:MULTISPECIES: hypothetical protein [unclassified Streptomyces]|uniref:hypothetical protein n=1 Tax=Streptomyces TaxID=1883 RepID=UPI000D508BF8|nr:MULTISPECIES: hypothetical protein [unclassified Streptomyces]MBQ0913039.1 hypothetical protein [Streptomyces sp. RM99]PVD05928.1 hypothetical protein DBP22_23730 [Streptomyces sp. CS207]
MGVFARLLRRSKTTEDASAEETRVDTPEAGGAAEERTAETVEAADPGPRDTAGSPEADQPAEAAEADGVGIPKQQSAGEAVDNEADKGART